MTETTANPEIPEDVWKKCANTCDVNNRAQEQERHLFLDDPERWRVNRG